MSLNNSRRGAVEMGTVFMILAFAVMGGFIYWLSGQAANERAAAALVEEEAAAAAAAAAAEAARFNTVAGEDIQADPTPFEGEEIRLADFNVASLLGSQGFWIEMPNGNPFLVSMSAEVMAEGLGIGAGGTTTVVGVVYAMNDSTLTAWTDAATIAEGDRIVAEFATHYLEAIQVEYEGAAPEGGAPGGGSGN